MNSGKQMDKGETMNSGEQMDKGEQMDSGKQTDKGSDKLKLFDSEFRLMELIWIHPPLPAKELSVLAAGQIGWNKNTTYTILGKLVDKGALRREDPGFVCTPLVSRTQVQQAETETLIRKLFHGSRKAFLSTFLQDGDLSDEEVTMLKALIDRKK